MGSRYTLNIEKFKHLSWKFPSIKYKINLHTSLRGDLLRNNDNITSIRRRIMYVQLVGHIHTYFLDNSAVVSSSGFPVSS